MPLTRTRRKLLTCGFATSWLPPAPVCAPRPSARRPWSLHDRLDERDIAKLITAYRQGATVTSLLGAAAEWSRGAELYIQDQDQVGVCTLSADSVVRSCAVSSRSSNGENCVEVAPAAESDDAGEQLADLFAKHGRIDKLRT